MKKKYLIVTPSYDENNGGCIVQHKLCSILNELGYESYVGPLFTRYYVSELSAANFSVKSGLGFIKRFIKTVIQERKQHKNYRTNASFNTPRLMDLNINFDESWVIIYPEVTFGNPLNAKNVVRWLLHQPGYHTNDIFYGKGELLVKFNSGIDDFIFPGSKTAEPELKIIHYPLEHYNLNNTAEERTGTAYCLRKGSHKAIQHDLTNSILIDGMSHAEIAEIFKRVKTFISYDTYTAYSLFAVLCGCESIVIPDEGVMVNDWYPNVNDRNGIAYGYNDIERARETAGLVKKHVEIEENKSVDNVKVFINEVESYFK